MHLTCERYALCSDESARVSHTESRLTVSRIFVLEGNSLNRGHEQRGRNVDCPEILCHLIKINETGPEKEFTLSLFLNSNFYRWAPCTCFSLFRLSVMFDIVCLQENYLQDALIS